MVGDQILSSRFLLLAAVGSCLAGAGCNSAAQSQRAQPPPPQVMVQQVSAADIPVLAEYPAQTYARNTVEVRGRVDGYIDKWLFRPGQEVHAGDVLYVLDQRPYEAAVAQAKGNVSQSEADLEFARKQVALLTAEANLAAAQANLLKSQQDFDRLTPLVKEEAAAQQELDTAVAALHAGEASVRASQANVDQTRLSTETQISSTAGKVEAQRAALRTAQLNLEYATIRAPISGLIGDTLVPVGGLVSLDPIWVRFKVTESQYLSFKKNPTLLRSALALVLADASEFPQKGHIENTLNQVDPKTGTLEIQASFSNPQHTLLPGQFGKVRVETDLRRNAILVPQRAIQQLQSVQTVFTVNGSNTVELRAIVVAERVGENWIVRQGLKPGDRVIVEGQLKVRAGTRVTPIPYHSSSSAPASSNAAPGARTSAGG
jgi:membrane fusion protein, multidrug efflux system